ncbi:D-Ala-D-Ala carboxypeptidase family metallohydrolase [Rhizobium sp. DKSPLA3]|uniref:D-Ala-D-Ala carboxypeptidase family metallohydrolase n=1 Tax=Rhizobium quercicola TaxID=2901226 RepID=A0A9X1T1C4_9HYPH|nr:D-Ala-D-Ala carboxypeptidase family metallohydrolase [Rhizobium quercicola]
MISGIGHDGAALTLAIDLSRRSGDAALRYGPSSKPFLASVGCVVFAAVLLTGCVTGKPVTDQLVEGVVAPEVGETDVPVVASGPASPTSPAAQAANGPSAAQMAAQPPAPAQPGAIVMQGTGLQATSSSIFSVGGTAGASPVSGGGSTPASLFRSAPQGQTTSPLSQQPLPLQSTDAGYQVQGAATSAPTGEMPAEAALATLKPGTAPQPAEATRTASLIGLFGKSRPGSGEATSASDKPANNKALSGMAGMAPQQVAALSYTALPGIRARSMFATVDDTAENHDDTSPEVQMASLSGLARLAPSGLLLQTETVETGCFKPQLLTILKSVERHFGKKVLVTSGRRSLAHNIRVGGRPQSRHLTCEAADIQVAGVSKWDVATFLRAADGRGGVGTYCHTQSVHIDIGPRRDWNWACGPRDA